MSVYVPPVTDGGSSSCSGGCVSANDQRYVYLGSYFNAHMLSTPSHRYAYIMYFVFLGILLIASALYHLGVGDQTFIGAGWLKFAPKSRLIKLGKPPDPATLSRTASSAPEQRRKFRIRVPFMHTRRVYTFPAFGPLILVFVMAAIPIILTLVGADYIDPNASMFDLRASWPSADSARYGYYGKRHLVKRVQWGMGNNPPIGVNVPNYSVPYHTWWTSGGRAGLMTNALTPIVVILALKQVPWAVMSTKLLGKHAFERLSFLHKWGGRLLWAFAAAHTIAWSVQLAKDEQFNTPIWSFVFLWPRFRWAFVSLGFLTLLVLLSLSPMRKHYYEWFYVSHIICALGFMIAAALHHPPLAPWMWAAIAWWAAERITRAIKVAYVNGIGFAGRKPEAQISPPNTSHPGQYDQYAASYGQQRSQDDWKPAMQDQYYSHDHHRQQSNATGTTLHEKSRSEKGIPPPAFLEHDPAHNNAAQAQDEDVEWELDENGDKVRRRPSRRYGPVSDLLKEYAARPMSGIEEDSSSQHGSGSGSSRGGRASQPTGWYAHDDADGVDIGIPEGAPPTKKGSSAYDDMEGPSSHSSHLPYSSGPSSSADHYASAEAAPTYHRERPAHQYSSQNGHGYQQYTQNAPSYHSHPHNTPPPPNTLMLQRAPRPALPADVAALLKPGYAFAQILPGKTIRLTLRTPNRMSWAPGQWVYLNIPAIRGWQSHPFTIASAHDADMPVKRQNRRNDDVEKVLAKESQRRGEERTMVLLLRTRKGFTLKLWDYVQTHRHRQLTAASENAGMGPTGKTTTGVHLRAIVDGAYGSTERVRWGVHSTVIIVCGGSGVSFGISVLEHLCACLKEMNEYGETHRGGKKFAVKRVRFVWVCREFSHLQWIASALRRCIEMVPPEQLQVDLFVTHLNNQAAMGGGSQVRPGTAGSVGTGGGEWQDAHGNVYQSNDFGSNPHRRLQSTTSNAYDAETEALQMDAIGLTQFEGEEDEGPTAREMQINNEIRKEGKLRRAHTRRATLKKRKAGRSGGDQESQVSGRPRQESQAMLAQRMMYEGQVPTRLPKDAMQDQGSRPATATSNSRFPRQYLSDSSESPAYLSRDQSPNGALDRQPYPHPHPLNGSYEGQALVDGGSDPLSAAANQQGWLTPGGGARQGASGSSSPGLTSLDRPATPSGHGALTPRPYTPPGLAGSYTHGFGSAGNLLSVGGDPAPIPGTPHSMRSSLMHHEAAPTQYTRSESHLLSSMHTTSDTPIDLDSEEETDLRIIAELAQFGHPRCDQIISTEIKNSQGRIMVASCGPSNLSALLRRIVAKHIDPKKVRQGDLSAHVNLCMENFDWGGS
ncbi:unnamed protein product [Sympodiomycopsis kandeliae]